MNILPLYLAINVLLKPNRVDENCLGYFIAKNFMDMVASMPAMKQDKHYIKALL